MTLTLQRYILRDLIKAFGLALVGVTALMSVVWVGQTITRLGLSIGLAARFFPLFVPVILYYTIPAALLFATTLVYGRFAHDNEYDAVRMSGIHPLVVIVPGAVLGTLVSCGVLGLAADTIPNCRHRIKALSSNVEVIQEALFRALEGGGSWSASSGPDRYTVSAAAMIGDTATEARIERRDKRGERDLFITAERAAFHFEERERDTGGRTVKERLVRITAQNAQVERGDGRQRARLTDEHTVWVRLPDPPKRRPRDESLLALLDETHDHTVSQKDRIERLTEIHRRLNLSASCLAFVLVGVPLAIRLRRGHIMAAFMAALGPMLLFHLVLFQAKNLSQSNGFSPASLWAATVVILVLAAILLRPMFRR